MRLLLSGLGSQTHVVEMSVSAVHDDVGPTDRGLLPHIRVTYR